MIDMDASLIKSMQDQADTFKAVNCKICQADSLAWLSKCTTTYDLVFLDPPFGRGMVETSINMLDSKNLLNPGALVYVEAEQDLLIRSENLKEFKHSRAGQVQYGLLQFETGKDH